MKPIILTGILAGFLCTVLRAQNEPTRGYRNFPLIVTLQFHSLTLPFRDLKTNFSNVGIGLGTEVSLNGKRSLLQQGHLMWYRNRTVGNGILVYTQTAWRPSITPSFYSEIKLGAGYLMSFRPVNSYKPVQGEWVATGHRGKGMLAIPLGVSIGYQNLTLRPMISPFASYQFLLIQGYNKSIPLVPQTLFQVGSRIHL